MAVFSIKPFKAMEVVFNPSEIEQSMANGCFPTFDEFVEQFFEEEPYVKIKNEDIIYHKSQTDQLIERLRELTNGK